MSDYKRLTERFTSGNPYSEYASDSEILERLAELEDKLENGTLIELPCKVGDKLYSIPFDNSKIFEHKVKGFRIIAISENKQSNYIETDIDFLFGENAFLTKAEAENKLKELKGEV